MKEREWRFREWGFIQFHIFIQLKVSSNFLVFIAVSFVNQSSSITSFLSSFGFSSHYHPCCNLHPLFRYHPVYSLHSFSQFHPFLEELSRATTIKYQSTNSHIMYVCFYLFV